jgi:hypothetical protein
MAEQSHRDEMNAAIRAQRERQAAPRTIAPIAETPVDEAAPAAPEPDAEPASAQAPGAVPQAPGAVPQAPGEAAPRKSMFDRLRGR